MHLSRLQTRSHRHGLRAGRHLLVKVVHVQVLAVAVDGGLGHHLDGTLIFPPHAAHQLLDQGATVASRDEQRRGALEWLVVGVQRTLHASLGESGSQQSAAATLARHCHRIPKHPVHRGLHLPLR